MSRLTLCECSSFERFLPKLSRFFGGGFLYSVRFYLAF